MKCVNSSTVRDSTQTARRVVCYWLAGVDVGDALVHGAFCRQDRTCATAHSTGKRPLVPRRILDDLSHGRRTRLVACVYSCPRNYMLWINRFTDTFDYVTMVGRRFAYEWDVDLRVRAAPFNRFPKWKIKRRNVAVSVIWQLFKLSPQYITPPYIPNSP